MAGKCPTCGRTFRYVRKGRRVGEAHPRNKLTQAQIEEIKASKESQKVLAGMYNISPVHVWRIKNGKTWVTESVSDVSRQDLLPVRSDAD